jgi:hypothetical protein
MEKDEHGRSFIHSSVEGAGGTGFEPITSRAIRAKKKAEACVLDSETHAGQEEDGETALIDETSSMEVETVHLEGKRSLLTLLSEWFSFGCTKGDTDDESQARRRNILGRRTMYQLPNHCTVCALLNVLAPIESDPRLKMLTDESDINIAPDTPGI